MNLSEAQAEAIIGENPKFVSLDDKDQPRSEAGALVVDRMLDEASACLTDDRADHQHHARDLMRRIESVVPGSVLSGMKKRGVVITTQLVRDIMEHEGI